MLTLNRVVCKPIKLIIVCGVDAVMRLKGRSGNETPQALKICHFIGAKMIVKCILQGNFT